MKTLLIALALLTACGDNLPGDPSPPETWRDVTVIWGESYCEWLSRCYPGEFADYGGRCAMEIAENSCRTIGDRCDEMYPEDHLPALEECLDDMKTLPCYAQLAPEACYRAFAR